MQVLWWALIVVAVTLALFLGWRRSGGRRSGGRAGSRRSSRAGDRWNGVGGTEGSGTAPGVSRRPIQSDEEWLSTLEQSFTKLDGMGRGAHARPEAPPLTANGSEPPSDAPVRPLPTNAGSMNTGSSHTLGAPAPAGDEDTGTLQLLPGRLETRKGHSDPEIRFVHRSGAGRFTFGRRAAEGFEHVRLPAPTVSRMHAFMERIDGRWYIGNLSETNPVRVNGAPLGADAARALSEGDRVEMGEVAFVFRER